MANQQNDDGIDYQAEGTTPPREKDDPTNDGYDEAAHKGDRYGVPEGRGGVFGTSGGGTFEGGMHVEERPVVYDGGGDENGKTAGARGVTERTPGTGREERDRS
jgi:hypothetical protein